MKDPFLENEWNDLCEHLHVCAENIGSELPDLQPAFAREAEQFTQQTPPSRYPELLKRVQAASELAQSWQQKAGQGEQSGASGSGEESSSDGDSPSGSPSETASSGPNPQPD